VVALAAYFDDSKNNDEGIFAVAGYLSMVSMWEDSFAPAWREVIKSAPRSIKEFKAADCRHRTNEFEGWEPDECKALTTQLVDVIVGPSIPSLVGIGAAVSIENFAELQEETRQRFERFAYLLCGGVVVDAVFQLTEQYVGKDDVTFIFDEQDELEARMRVVFKDLKQVLPLQFANKIRNRSLSQARRTRHYRLRIFSPTKRIRNSRTAERTRHVASASRYSDSWMGSGMALDTSAGNN